MTPVVFLLAGLFFVLAVLTYVEGASLHAERGGSTVFARYAFNELWSFVAGWALLLDYAILIAVCVLVASNYLAAIWGPAGQGNVEIAFCVVAIGYVAARNVWGLGVRRLSRLAILALANLGLLLIIAVVGFAQ